MAFAEQLPRLSGATGACLALQLLAVVLLWTLKSTVGVRGGASWRRLLGLWGGSQAAVPRNVTPVATHTSDLTQWAAAPGSFSFTTPQSRCTLHHNSTVELPAGWHKAGMPFLFDTASMPDRQAACSHCPPDEDPMLCCGVCAFGGHSCDDDYPGHGRSAALARQFSGSGLRLRAFSPCELFARIRGRTLWFIGDSQTYQLWYAAECFLREFAHSLRRTTALPAEQNERLTAVKQPLVIPPVCLELALGTRVCAIRINQASQAMEMVLPLMQELISNISSDLLVFNAGLHYETPGDKGKPVNESKMATELTALASWRQQHRANLPRLVWMDTPVQHFATPDGAHLRAEKPFKCRPLEAWAKGNPVVRAGGLRNIAAAPALPQLADAHLRTWNDSVPLWDSHLLGDCTHWCSPGTYQMWLYKLNDVLRDSGLGNAVSVAERQQTAAG